MCPITRKKCLDEFFVFLHENNIPYCVLGNIDHLPHSIPSDVDIVIDTASFRTIAEKISSFAQMMRINLVQLLLHEQTACYFVFAWADNNGILYLHPDICSDYYRRGNLFISSDELLQNRIFALDNNGNPKGFFIPAPEMRFIYYFIKKIHKSDINQAHFSYLQNQFQQSPDLCIIKLQGFWPKSETELITSFFLKNDFIGLQEAIPKLKKILIRNRRPTLKGRWHEFTRKIYRVLKPTGLSIALLGPDGCGKSTLNECLQQSLAPAFRGVKFFHLRPYLLPNLNASSKAPALTPHADKPRGTAASIVKLLFFFMDYMFGYWLKIRPLKVRSQLVIFDRYYHDILLDPIRYRYGAPLWIAKLVGQFLPKPDLFLVLDASAEIIQTRKQEVSLSETKRQYNAYLTFAKNRKNCAVINAERSIKETSSDANRIILDHMGNRFLKRIGKL